MPIAQAKITVSSRGQPVGRYLIEPGEYLVGSDPSCQIPTQTTPGRERSARLKFDGDSLQLEDLGGTTGTTIDGTRLSGRVTLRPGQAIQIGEATLEVSVEEALDATLPASPRPPVAAARGSGKYVLGEQVAEGGMGAILRARDRTIERTVAMKVVLPHRADSPDVLQRFRQEAKITGQLEHPNIVPVHELNTDENGNAYYTMKFVVGVTLHDVLERIKRGDAGTVKHYSLAHLLTIFQKVCDAVAFAHSKGVVHRDLKPANIMVGDYGEVLVMDWGLAKQLHEHEVVVSSQNPEAGLAPSLTMAGQVMGTPQFMAPEQAEGKLDEIDARTDIFSLGAILYNILTLHPPVSGDSVEEVLEKMRRGAILPPTSYNQKSTRAKGASGKVGTATLPRPPLFPLRHIPGGRVPESLSAVCMKALALRKDDRYPAVPDLQKDVEAFQGGFATSAERASAFKLIWLLIKRHKVEFLAAQATLLIVVAVAASFSIRNARTLHQLQRAAPSLYNEAVDLVQAHKLPEALQKITFATQLTPEVTQYQVLQGNIYETLLKFAEAQDSYRRALASDKNDRQARENLEFCEKILRDNRGRSMLLPASREEVANELRRQSRFPEAAVLMEGKSEFLIKMVKDGLTKLGLPGQVSWYNDPVNNRAGLCLQLEGPQITDLSPFRGWPINVLALVNTNVKDLAPLRTMPLDSLQLTSTTPIDLSPLKDLTLRSLFIGGGDAAYDVDLEPIKGLPLQDLSLYLVRIVDFSVIRNFPLKIFVMLGVQVHDISALRGKSLEKFYCDGSPLSDIRPLAGMPLKWLSLHDCLVSDISVLRGLPLEELDLTGTKVTDFSPLAGCQTLSVLILPAGAKNIDCLRSLPNLQRLSWREESLRAVDRSTLPTAAEFWKEYDAQKAKGGKP